MVQLTISESAAKRLKDAIQKTDPETGKPLGTVEDTYIRVFVRGGGCSGFQYGMALDHKVHEGDEVIQNDGVKFVVDPMSKEFVDGSTVDYVESISGSGFAITNPLNDATCGCGQSFSRKGEGAPDESIEHGHGHGHNH